MHRKLLTEEASEDVTRLIWLCEEASKRILEESPISFASALKPLQHEISDVAERLQIMERPFVVKEEHILETDPRYSRIAFCSSLWLSDPTGNEHSVAAISWNRWVDQKLKTVKQETFGGGHLAELRQNALKTLRRWSDWLRAMLVNFESPKVKSRTGELVSKSSDNLSRGELLTELRELKRDFSETSFNDIRCVVSRCDNESLMVSFGFPIVDAKPFGPVIQTGPSVATQMELDTLFSRAGELLQFVPEFGVTNELWKRRIERASNGVQRWGAFLSTGLRLPHCQHWTPEGPDLVMDPEACSFLWIDNIGKVSAIAISELLSTVLKDGVFGAPVDAVGNSAGAANATTGNKTTGQDGKLQGTGRPTSNEQLSPRQCEAILKRIAKGEAIAKIHRQGGYAKKGITDPTFRRQLERFFGVSGAKGLRQKAKELHNDVLQKPSAKRL